VVDHRRACRFLVSSGRAGLQKCWPVPYLYGLDNFNLLLNLIRFSPHPDRLISVEEIIFHTSVYKLRLYIVVLQKFFLSFRSLLSMTLKNMTEKKSTVFNFRCNIT